MTDNKEQLLREALCALIVAEAGLADIGDSDREPGDDLQWCEARAAQALALPRAAIIALSAAIAHLAAQEPEWVDDPHDIEQGMMRNPKWKPATNIAQPEQPAPVRQPLTDQDAKDAARYRFLKSGAYECVVPHGQKINGSREGWITKIHPGKDFDSSIDAAIAQPKDKP